MADGRDVERMVVCVSHGIGLRDSLATIGDELSKPEPDWEKIQQATDAFDDHAKASVKMCHMKPRQVYGSPPEVSDDGAMIGLRSAVQNHDVDFAQECIYFMQANLADLGGHGRAKS